jgi:hypothetical protein
MSQILEGIKLSYNEDFLQFKIDNYYYDELAFVNMLLTAYTLNESHPCIQPLFEQCDDDFFTPTLFNHNLTANYITFLKQRKQELKTNQETTVHTPHFQENSLNWIGGQTAIIELAKALIENGNVKGGTQNEIINKIATFFNVKINNQNKLINDLKIRNSGAETLFLDKLQKSLFNYITLEKDK